MSLNMRNSGATANGFRSHTLLKEKVVALHDIHYPAWPDMRAPHGWTLSINGILVSNPPTPTSRDWRNAVMRHYWGALTAEQRDEP